MSILAAIVAIIVVGGVALRLAVPALSSNSVASGVVERDGKSVLGDCPDTPNCQGSESSRDSQRVERFNLEFSSSVAISTLAEIIKTMPGTSIVSQSERYLHATYSTRIMGYTDDVEFLLSEDENNVQVRSASRLGKSDLGVNAQRVARLRELAEGKI